ncbi:KH domain-containing protein [Paucilactobacillus suebicus]|uniref:RNA-binding protein KhpA n=1 Tax=Paucilactobacillus suebicus DSM 5007 = KCTC 3549 TaxID=1423807 RepID=A0A0R1WE71_9LACO|nr:KH domain-containing protein [Paucilactobacillus suebicus]KRM13107.1 hypothetical protein FD16_GL001251 [Paucilactobacillus suebicus DSM 5007 = KCTC 3549]
MTSTEIDTLIRLIVQPIVIHPESIDIQVEKTQNFEQYTLNVHSDDVGRVIGRNGHVAAAIRTIVHSTINDKSRKVRLLINDHRNHETPAQ